MKLNLIRDNKGNVIGTDESTEEIDKLGDETEYTAEIIEAPEDYFKDLENFYKAPGICLFDTDRP